MRKQGYDSLGRPSSAFSTVGGTFTASVSYDANGRIDRQTYPSGLSVVNTYTALGYLQSVQDGRTGAALWTAQAMDAEGHVSRYAYGNGVVSNDSYYPGTGRLSTAVAGGGAVQSLSHTYDVAGRLKSRTDLALKGLMASYDYDELNRLKTETRTGGDLPSAQAMGWTYDAIGNMVTRTETGRPDTDTYNYNGSGAGSLRPHAVGSVSGMVGEYAAPRYEYDANGNLTGGAGRSVVWNSFNKVEAIAAGNKRLSWLYGDELERAQEVYKVNDVVQRTTRYMNPAGGAGLLYEEEITAAGTKRKHYLSAGEVSVGAVVCMSGSACTATQAQYWHGDAQGSVTAVTGAGGAVTELMDYEPFGKRRYPGGPTDQANTLTAATDRGYTGHEHLDEVGLINMNGRVYDPSLSRFMSADPHVTSPGDMQSYNRYSYVLNQPFAWTDPTGYDHHAAESHYGSNSPSYTGSYQGLGNISSGITPPSSSSSSGSSSNKTPEKSQAAQTQSSFPSDAKGTSAGEIAGQGIRATVDFLDGGYGAMTQMAFDRGDVAGVLGNTVAGAAYAGMNLASISVGAVAKLGTSLVAKEVVALDTNALIAATKEGKAAEVLAAIAERTPVVSRTAVREFLAGGNSVAVLRGYLTSIGARIAVAGTEAEAGALRAQATQLGRSLGVNDSRVAASAAREGAVTITNDKRFRNFLNAVGLGGLGF